MNNLEALVALNMAGEIGSIRLKELLGYFGRPENIFHSAGNRGIVASGLGEKIASKIFSIKKEDAQRELNLAGKLGLEVMTLEHPDYPANLKNIPDPPVVLYVKGKIMPADRFAVAVVGSRRASFYGLENAGRFACELSAKGFTVVSGMARGIDTAAHRGALKSAGRTIAVIGSGFGNIYPRENEKLAEEIAASGAVISEFPVAAKPLPQHFPQRNRVISGLSLGVLVVEAARNSGALITADFGLEQGREVFSLPGKVDAANSFGTHSLIKQGAKLVSSVDDILEELPLPPVAGRPQPQYPAPEATLKDCTQDAVFNCLLEEALHLDELAEKTNLEIPEISDILLKLQLKRLVQQLPGKRFAINSNIKNQSFAHED
jgi:DNA processing protein